MIRIGFTGTRRGMDSIQKKGVREIVESLNRGWDEVEFHHGDCIGADAEAHDIVVKIGVPIVIHPPLISSARAFKKGFEAIRPVDEYISRNHAIVDECNILIACPRTNVMETRSGTWATIRYAKKRNREVIIL